MDTSPSSLSLPDYQDRRTGLILFGILEIIAGGMCLLLIPFMIYNQVAAARVASVAPNLRPILPALMICLLMAGLLMVLGMGSVHARRWARALCLVLGWSWLVMGVMASVFFTVMLPVIFESAALGRQPMPPADKAIATVVTLLILGLVFIAVPGALVLFYRSSHVKTTCEACDAATRWTDLCPLPVIGLCFWLCLGAVMIFSMSAYNFVIGFFGIVLHGWSGAVFCVALAGIWLWAARLLYRLKPLGWWLVLIALALLTISNLITFVTADMRETYRLMGNPAAQVLNLGRLKPFVGHGLKYWAVVGVLPPIGFMFYVRRFLKTGPRLS